MKKNTRQLPEQEKDESTLNSGELLDTNSVDDSVNFDVALLESALSDTNNTTLPEKQEDNLQVIEESNSENEVEVASIDRRKAYGKLSMEEKFKKARRTKWFKSIRNKIILVYFFPKNKKLRLKQQKQIFIRRFNEFFGTNYRIDTVSSEFEIQYRKYVDSKGFIWAVRYWILIVGIIVLPIALYFIITAGEGM